MKLSLYFDHRYYLDAAGIPRSKQNFNYEYFQKRHLGVFDDIRILARLEAASSDEVCDEYTLGPGVTLVPIGNWHGPLGFLMNISRIKRVISREVALGSASIGILPGVVPSVAIAILIARGRKFAVEVGGDPWDVFSPGAYRAGLRPLVRFFSRWLLAYQCRKASAVNYVTSRLLQERYPCSPGVFSNAASNVELPEEAFVEEPKRYADLGMRSARLVFVGMLEQMVKAPDVALNAVAICHQKGMPVELHFVGDGRHRKDLEELASRLILSESVFFHGRLSAGEMVRQVLDECDMFIMPSRAEGLPRAMIEAMARGLFCIGTDVGGIPELIEKRWLVPPNDAASLAERVMLALANVEDMRSAARRNLDFSRSYASKELSRRWHEFYEAVAHLDTDRRVSTEESR